MATKRGIAKVLGVVILILTILFLILLPYLPISLTFRTYNNGYALEQVYSNLDLDDIVNMQHHGDEYFYVVEQGGRIFRFDGSVDSPTKELFLDIRDGVLCCGELGLLGLAFHPNYTVNSKFYVDYTVDNPRRTRISEFMTTGYVADTSSERILLEISQPFSNHNGGSIAFGPDGYLYISLGDGGSGGDPEDNGQDPTTLLGSILRIDVDTTSPDLEYAIPDDNPFSGSVSNRKEIFAYGLRNPWKMSFDTETGDLWAGDVGQSSFEEIDIIVSGGNYGWNDMEGFSCYSNDNCDKSKYILPVTDYPRTEGKAVTGGFVYRGNNLPGLVGRYVYGDYIVGRIWSLDATNPENPDVILMMRYNISISSFAQDIHGEIYVLDYSGDIYQIVAD